MHLLRKSKIGRRRMLRGLAGGAAVAVGLPMLDAMLDDHGTALASGVPLPLRFISFLFGNGVVLDRFEPTVTGAAWQLSEQLTPFAAVKDYVTVCTGMRNPTTSFPYRHHEGMTAFSGYDLEIDSAGALASNWGGPTIDQVIADIIQSQQSTLIHSLQVGGTKFESVVNLGNTPRVLSCAGEPGNLVPKFPLRDPRAVWQALFGELVEPQDDDGLRLGVLDVVRDDISELQSQLGQVDRHRLEAHVQNIAELEHKIAATPPMCTFPPMPVHLNDEVNGEEDLVLTNRLMADLIAYAFRCDLTRVASNLFCAVANEAIMTQAGSTSTHHHHSHVVDVGYHLNIMFCMERLAELMQVLHETPDGEGNLLDSTLVFASSEISQGWSHSIQRQPIIVGGHGRGYLRYPGIHHQAIAQRRPGDDVTAAGSTTDILLTLARCFEPSHPRIGAGASASETPLAAILA
ncbi:MAG: DUF1552 domain-containing protein [Deltaproteobacteria bacterium]|nr:DUF1552 domain-containing protein [Deltaproteobacteria bacterium]